MVVVDHQKREVFVDRRYAGVFEKGDLKEAIPAKARDGNYARADADLNEPPLSYTEPRKPASLEPKDAQQG
ncbi:MAG TPA: hypothetical protein VJB06_02805 [archaeon]|nr:hypothetical protein [archaeon]